MNRAFVLAAGGTGGHMVPAHALAAELRARQHEVALVTDERGARIPGLFDGVPVHVLPAGRLTGKPQSWLPGLNAIRRGRAQAVALYRALKPAAVVGFGGYPAFPALVAALGRRLPTAVHEQNAVLGRVNRLLGGAVDRIATSYPEVERVKAGWRDKVRLVGNPVREAVLRLREQPFPGGETFAVLVTGGSQGATILGRVVPEALGRLPEVLRARLRVVQQARPEDIGQVRARYAELGIAAELETYLADMPARLAKAQLVIGRAGASTIAELTAAGRPAVLVPLAIATDDHQTANVREMVAAGGARAIAEDAFTPDALAAAIVDLAGEPGRLVKAVAAAWSCGRPRATQDLADLVEELAA